MSWEHDGWLRKILKFKFVGYLITKIDIHNANRNFSVQAQSGASLNIDILSFQANRENYIWRS